MDTNRPQFVVDFLVAQALIQVFFCTTSSKQVRIYMGDGWRLDFKKTHFDLYSPPDFYTRVRIMMV